MARSSQLLLAPQETSRVPQEHLAQSPGPQPEPHGLLLLVPVPAPGGLTTAPRPTPPSSLPLHLSEVGAGALPTLTLKLAPSQTDFPRLENLRNMSSRNEKVCVSFNSLKPFFLILSSSDPNSSYGRQIVQRACGLYKTFMSFQSVPHPPNRKA